MPTLLRLISFLRPYRTAVAMSAFFGAGLMVCTLSLPYITRLVIDDVIRGGQRNQLAPLLIGGLVIICVRFVFNLNRRIWAGRISLGVEYDLRDAVFGHIQRLSFAFFDENHDSSVDQSEFALPPGI